MGVFLVKLEQTIGVCLVSQDIRERIQRGLIHVPHFNEERIQPSSFEPTLGNEVFMLDTEEGLFQPRAHETVYQTLLTLPLNRRRSHSLEGGFELKRGFTYLLPLEERVRMDGLVCIKSSPKSSTGRVFLNTRLIADYNPYMDELSLSHHADYLHLWLVVQPLVFNVIVTPGLSLNQLRFLTAYDAQLTPAEIHEEIQRHPLLFQDIGGAVPASHVITSDGLEIHLDLSGKATEGIVGLRARHNPEPLDLSKKGTAKAEEYFEPMKGEKGEMKLRMVKGEYYLLSTTEVLRIPQHLNVEMQRFSSARFTGPLDFAGFVDNGFIGDLVLEPRSDELSSIILEHGMPIGSLKVFRTSLSDKLYGEKTGAHYQHQYGPRTAKFLQPFDFTMAAKNYEKLNRQVLVQDERALRDYNNGEGFLFLRRHQGFQLLDLIQEGGFFHSRYDCEDDERVLQIIPYVLLFGKENTIFSYVRASHIKDFGDPRLFGKYSIGLGGHIIPTDGPQYLENCIKREVIGEEVDVHGICSEPRLMGTLMRRDQPVDRVHFGLIYALHTNGEVSVKESSLVSGRMVPFEQLQHDPDVAKKYETWSTALIPHLPDIYQRSL